MKRRRLIALISVCTLAVLGLVAVVAGLIFVRTDLARRLVEGQIASAITGSVHVGRLSGNLFSGITIDSLEIRDASGEVFLSTGQAAVDYDIRDLMDTRLYLRHLVANHPYINLHQHPGGEWNFQRIFAAKKTGPRPARA